jgi:hypothetical protein
LDAANSEVTATKSELVELQELPHELPPSAPDRTTTTNLEELKRANTPTHQHTNAPTRNAPTHQRTNAPTTVPTQQEKYQISKSTQQLSNTAKQQNSKTATHQCKQLSNNL